MLFWKEKVFASAINLVISTGILAFVVWLLFRAWYSNIYLEVSSGHELFLLLFAVNLCSGPLITLVIYNRAKPCSEMRMSLALVGLLQLVLMAYGSWIIAEARPVHLIFEYSRLVIVHAAEIDPLTLQQAPLTLQKLPFNGPTLLSLRPFKNADEQLQSTMMALNGVPQSMQPALWQSWDSARASILKESKPVSELVGRFAEKSALIEKSINATGRQADQLRYLPLLVRKTGWTALIDANSTEPVIFFRLDSF